MRLEPLVERTTQRRGRRGEEKWRAFEAGREIILVARGEFRRAEYGDPALPQKMIVNATAYGRRRRRVGDDQIDSVKRKLGEEPLGLVLVADDLRLFAAKMAGAYDWVGALQSAWKRLR